MSNPKKTTTHHYTVGMNDKLLMNTRCTTKRDARKVARYFKNRSAYVTKDLWVLNEKTNTRVYTAKQDRGFTARVLVKRMLRQGRLATKRTPHPQKR